jgi:hypothetical protein
VWLITKRNYEQLGVLIVRNLDRRVDSKRLGNVRNGVAVSDDERIAL